ncbi:hypothetical protein JOB18_011953 [Solea senegalensis]|uniref:Secreted protein n=1 Tax=Solea senegalensis TaxID=28829 RepID=A0AAV6QKJ6_SOLSE|nr:hypothetical protein JOB18_011953 [Solea senegalensis]
MGMNAPPCPVIVLLSQIIGHPVAFAQRHPVAITNTASTASHSTNVTPMSGSCECFWGVMKVNVRGIVPLHCS